MKTEVMPARDPLARRRRGVSCTGVGIKTWRDLLVCEEFDGCVGEDSEEGCGVAAEEPAHAVLPVDVAHRGYDAEP